MLNTWIESFLKYTCLDYKYIDIDAPGVSSLKTINS